MRCFQSKAMAGALALAGMMFVPPRICAQAAVVKVTITVEENRGGALAGATVTNTAGELLGRTGPDGRLKIECAAPCAIVVAAQGFAEQSAQITGETTMRLEPSGATEVVTVTAYRAPLDALESPATTRLLSAQALDSTA